MDFLEGEWRPNPGLLILEFPTFERTRAWYDSPEYAPLRAPRHQHERFDIVLVDGLGDEESLLGLGMFSPAERAHVQDLDRDDAQTPDIADTDS